jgi:hypothetical protein
MKKATVILLAAAAVSVSAVTALADATYQLLPFCQDWTNTGLITIDDNWAGVPGIIGYRGDDLTTLTNVDPQTILADSGPPGLVVDVNANRNDPSAFLSGGVAEFEGGVTNGTNPVVAYQGSGTSDAPSLVLHVNTTGLINIRVQYNLRDIDGNPTANAAQWVALQYRVGGGTGNYTNVPAGFVADATTGPSDSSLVTPVNVVLPFACENQAQVQLRIITSNVTGNDEEVGIDDICITGDPVTPVEPTTWGNIKRLYGSTQLYR